MKHIFHKPLYYLYGLQLFWCKHGFLAVQLSKEICPHLHVLGLESFILCVYYKNINYYCSILGCYEIKYTTVLRVVNILIYCSFLCCLIMHIYVLSTVLWCPLSLPHKHDVQFFSILWALCCHFLWIVHFWLPPSVFSNVYSLMLIVLF